MNNVVDGRTDLSQTAIDALDRVVLPRTTRLVPPVAAVTATLRVIFGELAKPFENSGWKAAT